MDEPDFINLTPSPPIEDLVESIEQPTAAFKPYRINRFQPKRVKNEEYDTVNLTYHSRQETGDDCEAFGRCVAAQLRQMPTMQKFLAERIISEVCFRGQVQSLQMNTTLSTQATVFQQHQPFPVYNTRSHFGRGLDYTMAHQHGTKHQTHMPVNSTAASIHHQTQQQSEHTPSPINPMVNMRSTENIQ